MDYLSLTRAVTVYETIKDFVSSAIRHNENNEKDNIPQALKHNALCPADWYMLCNIIDLLQPIHKWQICLQKPQHYRQIHEIFSPMD